MCVRKRTVLGNVNLGELTVNLRKWVRKRSCVGEQQLFAHCLLIAELIKLRKFFTHSIFSAVFIKLRKFFTHCKFKEEFIKRKQVP